MLEPVRISQLKLMSVSPAHYKANHRKQTRCMEEGSAVDCLVLGTQKVIAYPGKVRNGKDWEAFKTDNQDKLIVTAAELSKAEAMKNSVFSNRLAMQLLEGERQKEINWQFLNRDCVSHLDVLGNGFVTDLKTTQTAHPDRFRWKAMRLWYHAQLAFYQSASGAIGLPAHDLYIVAVESEPPFAVTCLKLGRRMVELGHMAYRGWFERLLACEAANEWPAYAQSIVEMEAEEDLELKFDDE